MIPQLLEELSATRETAKLHYDDWQQAKKYEAQLRDELFTALRAAGLESAKSKDFTASIATKPAIQINDERAVMEWLKNTPDIESDLYIGVKKSMFDPLALTVLKKDGEIIPGTEVQNTEYLSVRKAARK